MRTKKYHIALNWVWTFVKSSLWTFCWNTHTLCTVYWWPHTLLYFSNLLAWRSGEHLVSENEHWEDWSGEASHKALILAIICNATLYYRWNWKSSLSIAHDGTSWESVPCRSGRLHLGYSLSSLLKWSHLAIMLIARHNMTHQKFHLNNFTNDP